MLHVFKSALLRMIEYLGYVVLKKNHEQFRCSMEPAIRSIANRSLAIQTIIDVGASNGGWAEIAMRYLPDSYYLLVEAQPVHQDSLEAFCANHPRTQFLLAAAGDREGEIFFDASDPFGGQAANCPYPENNLVVPVTRIDTAVAQRQLPGPYLLKLDTHGFEVQILQGASSVLQNTEVVIVESYNFRLSEEGLLFHEMITHMSQLGFRCIDLVDVLHRPGDDALWQMDLVFLKQDRPEFRSHQYK